MSAAFCGRTGRIIQWFMYKLPFQVFLLSFCSVGSLLPKLLWRSSKLSAACCQHRLFPLSPLYLDSFIFGSNAVKWKCDAKEEGKGALLSQTGGPGLCRWAPGAPLTESEREEGPSSLHYTGGVKHSHLSTPEIFRFFQRRCFDLGAIGMGTGVSRGEKTTKTRGRAAHLRANRLTFLYRE